MNAGAVSSRKWGIHTKYKAVIFDLDGVICSTDRYHYLAWKKLADEIGVYFDETINNRLRGVSRMDSLEIILRQCQDKEFSADEKKSYADQKNTYYREMLKNMVPADVSPEVRDTLDRIKARNIRTAIGSSSKNARYILQRIGLEDYFDAIADGNSISHSKPDPEVFLKASECLHIDPELCLVVEDAQSGLEAASAANMDCAAIGDAAGYSRATYKLKTFSDLLLIV